MRANVRAPSVTARRMRWGLALLVVVAAPSSASAAGAHSDPVGALALALAAILVAAKVGGDLAVRLKQPAVLGELVAGVLMGNLGLAGFHGFDVLKTDVTIDMLARLGALILLFEVGLESTVKQMLEVGLSSFFVASLGVVAPFALGWGVGAWLLPGASVYVHAFLGATLTATSVGITARVLKDLQQSKSPEARIILGAAVIDDVLGLVVLAVVTGIISAADRGAAMAPAQIAWIFGKAVAFLVGGLVVGRLLSLRAFRVASRLRSPGVLVSAGLALCFTFAWLADRIGLAPIVGAFAAGLVLEDVHYRDFTKLGEQPLEKLIQPISSFLVPIFFVLMGLRTDLRAFANVEVLKLAAALTVAAVVGKQACSLGVFGRGPRRVVIGIGMIPRGEVGLIFANIGLSLRVGGEPIIDRATFSAVVVMVIVTTMMTPPLLKVAFGAKGPPSSRRHVRA